MSTPENPASMLALKINHNNYMPIDINSLGIGNNKNLYTLSEIDELIFMYGEDFIRELIKNNNLVDDKTLKKELIIVLPGVKRYVPLINKTVRETYDLKVVLEDNISDKEFVNHIINNLRTLKTTDEIKFNLNSIIQSGNILVFWAFYLGLPYIVQRELYLRIIKEVIRKEEKNVKVRGRKEGE